MISITEVLNPLVWVVAMVGAAIALLTGARARRDVLLTASAVLALAALGLLASLAVAGLLPSRALVVHPDGSTGDPRAISAVALGVAALLGLVPAMRSLRLSQLGLLGVLVPGLGLGGLVAVVSYFAGLRAPMALVGVLLAGIVLGTGVALFARVRWSRLGVFALQMAATGLLVVAGVLSLNGARAQSLSLGEGAALDTLGCRVTLGAVEAPHDSLRRLQFVVADRSSARPQWAALEGRVDAENRSVAAGGLLGGPVVVPISLQELRPQAHDVVWLARGDSIASGSSMVTFVGFRIVPGDTVRMVADLDVTTAGRTERVSPGMRATSTATTPYAAVSRDLGPIALGKIDADNGRVALMLPTPSATAVKWNAQFELHTRPALPLAWVGGALVALLFVLGFAAPPDPNRDRA